jgi:hypothetical protein
LGHLPRHPLVEVLCHRVASWCVLLNSCRRVCFCPWRAVEKQKKPARRSAQRLSFSPAYAATDRPDQGRDAPRLVFRLMVCRRISEAISDRLRPFDSLIIGCGIGNARRMQRLRKMRCSCGLCVGREREQFFVACQGSPVFPAGRREPRLIGACPFSRNLTLQE